jgi:hypothetical protein
MFEPQRKAIPTEQRVAKTNAGAWCSESRIAFQNGFMKIYGSSDKEMILGLGPGQSVCPGWLPFRVSK